jgi:hypothetical protein
MSKDVTNDLKMDREEAIEALTELCNLVEA